MNAPDPLFLATATEIVLKAGDIQRARRESGFRVDKKGSIDLVTEVDLECERMCRAILADRFPEHDVLGEELSPTVPPACARAYRWVYDPLDGTTNYAHGLPIYCSSLALEIEGGAAVAAIYDPSRQELFTAEQGQGAFLNGTRLQVSATGHLIDALLVTGFPYDVHLQSEELVGQFGAFLSTAQGGAPPGFGRAGSVLRGGRALRRLLGAASEAVGRRGRGPHRDRSRRHGHGHGWRPLHALRAAPGGVERRCSRRRC